MITRITVLAAAALIFASSVSAQYAGPGASSGPMTIAEALRSPGDTRVELEGFIIKKVGEEKYIFSDGKDQIEVEIDDKDFPLARIDDKTKVRISGEIEKGLLKSPKIDVESVTVL